MTNKYLNVRNGGGGQMATRAYCNSLKSGAFSSELTQCPTKQEILSAGLRINGDYADNQLVAEGDILSLVSFIITGTNGYIDKIEV
jgi:hypothetical protein